MAFALPWFPANSGHLGNLDTSQFGIALVVVSSSTGELHHPSIVEESIVRCVDSSKHEPHRALRLGIISHDAVLVARLWRFGGDDSLPLTLLVFEVQEVHIAQTSATIALSTVDNEERCDVHGLVVAPGSRVPTLD